MAAQFSSGKHSIALCDRCGQQFKLTKLKPEIVKTRPVNNRVCPQCWDKDHPQLQLGMYPVTDPQAVRNPRPDQSYTVSGLTVDGAYGEGSRRIEWGWNPVGGGNSFYNPLTPNALVITSSVGTVTVTT